MFERVSALAMPFFAIAAILVATELLISLKTKSNLYNRQDTVCNLLIFIGARLTQPLFLGYNVAILKSMERFALFDMPNTLANTLLCIVLTDLVYYFDHRFSHKYSLLWFFHEVHHSSKTFNLTTSFRLHWLSRLTAPIIFAPLIFMGFKAEQIAIFFATNLIYQFFLHTKTVGKLGVVEGILNTPSAHRVHHARNPIYIDKNFGGILVVWDRFFKTYQAETEEPEFGIVGDFASHTPVTVQFHKVPFYSALANSARRQMQNLILIIMALALTTMINQAAVADSEENSICVVNNSTHKSLEGFVQNNDVAKPATAKPSTVG